MGKTISGRTSRIEGCRYQDAQDTRVASYINNALGQMFDVFHVMIGTSFNVEKYSFFQSNLDGMKGGKYIPFDWMCTAMGDKTTVQDLLLMNYHGMRFSPIL